MSAFPGSCPPLSPIVSPHVCLCWMARSLPDILSCLPLSLGWRVRLSQALSLLCPLSPSLAPCIHHPAFLPACLPAPRLSSILSPSLSSFFFPFVGRRIRPPPCPTSPFLIPFVGWRVSLPAALSLLPACLLACLLSCLPSWFSLLDIVPLVPHLVSQLGFLLASLCWMVCPIGRSGCPWAKAEATLEPPPTSPLQRTQRITN